VVSSSLAHEGLMPPRTVDVRLDPQAQAKGIFNFLGDDRADVIRLRRTYDTWSTEYTQAPATGFDATSAGFPPYGLGVFPPGSNPYGTSPAGLNPGGTISVYNPVYPSYPAPYPVPLRGIQIQVRVVDPRNERVKVLTIRQDFSDKIANHP
jgi:hypothetical protein